MIVVNHQLQALECDICGEATELSRRVAESPEVLAMVREALAGEHKPCELFPDNPERARAERIYCAGMREANRQPKPQRAFAGTPRYARARRCR